MVNFCAIVGCSNKSNKDTSVSLYRFPQISKHAKPADQALQKKRRALWIERIKRDDVKEENINYFRICANHFLKGKPADLLDEDNPDWAPCINLGYKTVHDKRKKIIETHHDEDDKSNDDEQEQEQEVSDVDNESIIIDKNSSDDDSVKIPEKAKKNRDVEELRDEDNDSVNDKNSSDDDVSVKRHDKGMKSHDAMKVIREADNDSVNEKNTSDDDSLNHHDRTIKHHAHNLTGVGNNLLIGGGNRDNILFHEELTKRNDKAFEKHRGKEARDVENNLTHSKTNSGDDDVTMNNDSRNKKRPRVVKTVKKNPLPGAKNQFLNAHSLISKAMAAGTVSPERSLQRKPLDVNKYATKKTIAQGMLDIALLTANASQLKYILQVGEKHEFYSLMLALISISIILQVAVAVLSILLTQFDVSKDDQEVVTEVLNHAALGFSLLAMVSDVIKMSFGLDPALSFKDFDRYRNITRK